MAFCWGSKAKKIIRKVGRISFDLMILNKNTYLMIVLYHHDKIQKVMLHFGLLWIFPIRCNNVNLKIQRHLNSGQFSLSRVILQNMTIKLQTKVSLFAQTIISGQCRLFQLDFCLIYAYNYGKLKMSLLNNHSNIYGHNQI